MKVARIAISLDQDLARAVRSAARGEATSAWLADAARRKLRAEGLLQAVTDWESEHGALTDAELAIAAKKQRKRKRR